MCNVMVATTIIEVLEEKVKNQDVFTAFDVTVEARNKSTDKVPHSDVRNIVGNEFITNQLVGYDRELRTLNISGNPQALVYFPAGKSADDHPLVSSITVTDDDTDDDDDDSTNDPDVFNLTKRGRINIPKKMIAKIALNAGSYDVLINGSLKCIAPNKDGRVRLSLRKYGITDDKVRLIADNLLNIINVDTI